MKNFKVMIPFTKIARWFKNRNEPSVEEKIKREMDKLELKHYAYLAASNNSVRGNCYTVMVGTSKEEIINTYQVYERDKNGNPTKGFEKLIIMEDKSHSIDSYIKSLEKDLKK